LETFFIAFKLLNANSAITNTYVGGAYNAPKTLNVNVQFAYPAEQQDITKAYLKFNQWAESKGTQYTDWYLDKAGYRDSSKLYKKEKEKNKSKKS
jgi:hypothetical protein